MRFIRITNHNADKESHKLLKLTLRKQSYIHIKIGEITDEPCNLYCVRMYSVKMVLSKTVWRVAITTR